MTNQGGLSAQSPSIATSTPIRLVSRPASAQFLPAVLSPGLPLTVVNSLGCWFRLSIDRAANQMSITCPSHVSGQRNKRLKYGEYRIATVATRPVGVNSDGAADVAALVLYRKKQRNRYAGQIQPLASGFSEEMGEQERNLA